MAKKIFKQTQHQQLLGKRWSKLLLAGAFLAISYGFASLAIDSGSLLEYAVSIIFFVQAIMHSVHAIRNR